MPKTTPSLTLTERQRNTLLQIISQKKTERRFYQRASIILAVSHQQFDSTISKSIGLERGQVRHWRQKWKANQDKLTALEGEENDRKYREGIISVLSDELRPGCPPIFTAEQVCQIIKLSCEIPESHGYPINHWSAASLRESVIQQGIVSTISKTQVGRFLKSGRFKATQSKGLDYDT